MFYFRELICKNKRVFENVQILLIKQWTTHRRMATIKSNAERKTELN